MGGREKQYANPSGCQPGESWDGRDLVSLARADLLALRDGLVRRCSRKGRDEQSELTRRLHLHEIDLELQRRALGELQEVLERSRQRFDRLYELMPVGLLSLDPEGTIRAINRPAAELFGAQPPQLIDRAFEELLGPAAGGELRGHVAAVFSGSGLATHDVLVRLPGNLARRLRLVSVLDPGAGDTGPQTLTTCTDLSEGDSFALGVLNALPARVAVLDGSGRIVAVNDAWRRFAADSSASPALIDGSGIDYLSVCRQAASLGSTHAAQAEGGISSVLAGRAEAFALEYPCHSPSTQCWFLMTATPLGPPGAGVVVAHVDVTERKLREQDRLRRGEALARAQRLNSLAIMASSLVHELTQPLTAASLYSDGIAALVTQSRPDDGELAEAVRSVGAQIKRASDIVYRLRNFIRGRPAKVTRVVLRTVVERAIKMVEPMARDKNVELVEEGVAEDLVVEGDAVQIEQVIVNLLCNAVEAVDAADGERRGVWVRGELWEDVARVSVEDSGLGLAPERVERIFDIFETSKDSGLGMGLAICRDIIEAHRGQLWVAGRSDRGGSAFRFTLPLAFSAASGH
jgi:two-component system sensor kinase FixL